MLSYRDGHAIVVCDGCFEPIGPATLIDDPSDERRAHVIASGRTYAVLNGGAHPLDAPWTRHDGRQGDVHGPECGARLNAQRPVLRSAEQTS